MRRILPLVAVLEVVAILVLSWLWLGGDAPCPQEDDSLRPVSESSALPPPDANAPSEVTTGGAAGSPVIPLKRKPLDPSPGAHDGPLGILVYGQVLDQQGQPVPQGRIAFRDRWSAPRRAPVYATFDKGAYAVPALQPGKWELKCTAKGSVDRVVVLDLDRARGLWRQDLVLTRATTLKVRFLTKDGKPLKGFDWKVSRALCAIATRQRPTGDLPPTMTATAIRGIGIGRWLSGRYGRGQESTLEVQGSLPIYVSAVLRHIILETKEVGPNQEVVTFLLSSEALKARLATVKMQVLEGESDRPVTGARISISDSQSGGPGGKPGPEGCMVVSNLVPGWMECSVSAPDRERFYAVINLKPGSTTDLGTIRLHRDTAITGKVVDAHGKGVRASLYRCDLDSNHLYRCQAEMMRSSHSTDTAGHFKVSRCGRRRYLLVAKVAKAGMDWQVVDASGGPQSDITFRIRPACPVEIVAGKGLEGRLYLTLKDELGIPFLTTTVQSTYPRKTQLPAGRYTVEVRQGEQLAGTMPFVVEKGASNQVVINL